MNSRVPSPQPIATPELDRLDSWKQIAAYLGKSERTVRRWQETEMLPVHRHVHQQRGSVWAYRKELDDWLNGRQLSPEPLREIPERQRRLGPWGIRAGAAIGLTSLAAIIAVVWAVVWHSRQPSAITIPEPVPLTALPGSALGAAFSPDGRQVAFYWVPASDPHPGIYLKSIGSEAVAPLIIDKPSDHIFSYGPAWSPDGKTIAFLRRFPPTGFGSFAKARETWLYLIDSSGGLERRLIRLATNVVFYASQTHLSWTPDSQWIVAPMADGERRGIHRISVATAETRRITNATEYEFAPLLSPDGRALVFMRKLGRQSSMQQVLRQNLAADGSPQGTPRVLYQGRSTASGLAWTPSGKELVFCASDSPYIGPVGPLGRQLYRLSADAPRPLASLGLSRNCSGVAISRPDASGRAMLVYGTDDNSKSRLWQADLGALDRAIPLAPSSRFDGLPSYSPDGSLAAFVSNRSGNPEIWVTYRNGTGTKKITEDSHVVSTPRWSPDGSRLLYGAEIPPQADPRSILHGLYIIPIVGGAPSRVRLGMQNASDPSWSPDGQWIFYWSQSQLWRAHADGTGSVLWGEYPAYFFLSGVSDDKHMYYTRVGKPFALCRIALETRKDEVLADELLTPFFAVTQKFIYFIKHADQSLYALPQSGGPLRRVGSVPQLNEGTQGGVGGVSVSPDDASIVWAASGSQQLDLQLVRNFR